MLGIVSRIGQRVGIVADQSRYAVSSLINRSILPVSSSRFQSSKKKGGKSSGGNSKGVPKARSNDVDNRASNSPDASRGGSSNSNSSSNRSGGGGEREIIMHMKEITKVLPGGRVLFANVNLAFQKGAKIGILGLNGAGKSSILKILAGVDSEFDGELWRANHLRIGYLAQEPQLDESRGVHENIMDGLREKTDLLKRFDEINAGMYAISSVLSHFSSYILVSTAELASDDGDNYEKLLAELEEVQNKIEHYDCWNLSHTVQIAKEALRVPADDADVKTLSGGERRRIALCRLLLEQPDVLLLDEPTNHLDATSVAWLERFLQDYKGTVLAITHDRYFLDNVAGWILEIDRGVAYPYEVSFVFSRSVSLSSCPFLFSSCCNGNRYKFLTYAFCCRAIIRFGWRKNQTAWIWRRRPIRKRPRPWRRSYSGFVKVQKVARRRAKLVLLDLRICRYVFVSILALQDRS